MESKIKDDSISDSFFGENDKKINLFKDVMNKTVERKNIIMSDEIKKKQKIINKLIKEKFGNNFIPIKFDSLTKFQKSLKTFLFSPQSYFLNNFPRLRRKLIKEEQIREKRLKEKINMGNLLYLYTSGIGTYNNKNINDKCFRLSKNLSPNLSKKTLTDVLYKVKFEKENKERLNKILSFRELRKKHLQELQIQTKYDNFGNSIPEVNISNNNNNNGSNSNKIKVKTHRPLNKFISRNISSNQYQINSMNNTPYKDKIENNSIKSFSPISSFSTTNQNSSKKYLYQPSKTLQKSLSEHIENLNGQTKLCNKKLIKLMNCNRNINLKKNVELIYNLKKFLVDEKKRKKHKKRINNILQIKSLINKAQLDNEGGIKREKIRKKELKHFGHYINIMSDDLVLYKVNELYTEEELKQKGRNYSDYEKERMEKENQKYLINIYSMKKVKDNYRLLKKLEYDLSHMKIKFYETDFKTLQK